MERRILTRRNAGTLRNQENQENGTVGIGNQRLLRNKQNATGASLLPRPTNRTALGDIRNRQDSQRDGSNNLKSNGYGSQVQSRLVKKPEPRRPLRCVKQSASEDNIKPSSSDQATSKPPTAPKAFLGANNRLSIASEIPSVVVNKPLTRAAARKSSPTPMSQDATINKDASMRSAQKEPTPDFVAASEAENDDPSSTISADVGELKDADAYSTAMILNIDDGDEENPQLVTEYVADIYSYLRNLEKVQTIKEDFLYGKQVTPKMRAILVDWLVQVHVRFHLLPETLYMTVMIIDRYVSRAEKVNKDNLQLVGVTAMFVASKFEEMYAPEVGDFVYITDNSYSKKQILRMEIEILKVLDFELGRPLPIHFLRRFSKAAEADVTMHSLSKYFMELSLVEYGMAHYKPSELAAAALWLSLRLLKEKNSHKWSATLNHYTCYSEEDLKCCVQMICKTVMKVHSGKSKLQAVRNKHGTSKFQEISRNSALNLDEFKKVLGLQ